jgi:Chitobiase/beta-hexosaminidase C-terminal domain
MRLFFLSALLVLIPFVAIGQSPSEATFPDPTLQAAQQAQPWAIQQAQAAQRDWWEANRQAAEANRRAMDEALPPQSAAPAYPAYTLPPKFSLKPGHYKRPITVSISTPQRDATIYYTLDGWKPSTESLRYRGPIVINQTTTLCAIVVVPESTRSLQASAEYVIAGTAPLSQPELNSDLLELPLRDGTPFLPEGVNVPLAFTAGTNSQIAKVGDQLTLALTQDLRIGNTLVASKGASATSTVVQVNRSGVGGAPGTLVVEPEILDTSFGPIPLGGSVTKEGDPKLPNAAFLIPVVGETQIFRHGSEAVIARGAFLIAFVAKDTPLPSSQHH